MILVALHPAALDALPDGAFVREDDEAWLVLGPELLRWSPAGYVARVARQPARDVSLITPPSLVEVLRRGWESDLPLLHPTAVGQEAL